jgi:hypothetical protein
MSRPLLADAFDATWATLIVIDVCAASRQTS